jgi:2-oxoglutarate ferredoxin oxidoreductase subunit alpha
MRWGNSGGLPVIVLAPVDVKDCFLLTMHAFNLAEEFRCPVFIASNKEIAMTRESIDLERIKRPDIKERTALLDGKPFLPFDVTDGRMVPDFLPIGSDVPVRQTSSTHGPDGYITTNSNEIEKNQKRLKKKLVSAVNSFSFYEEYINEDSDTLLITYGITTRAARAACEDLKKAGKRVSHLVLKTLWPVPEDLIREKTKNFKHIVGAEMNLGQYVREIERILPEKQVKFYGQMDGSLIYPDRIKEVITNV